VAHCRDYNAEGPFEWTHACIEAVKRTRNGRYWIFKRWHNDKAYDQLPYRNAVRLLQCALLAIVGSCRVLIGERECDGAAAHAEAGDVAACRKSKGIVGSAYTGGLTRLIVQSKPQISLRCHAFSRFSLPYVVVSSLSQ